MNKGFLLGAALGSVGLVACATKSVELKSDPVGAEVLTMGGEILGSTPMVLKEDALDKATTSDGILSLKFDGPGYLPQTLLVEVRGNDSYRVRLTKLDNDFFKKYVMRDFAAEHNAMIREMLNIQGLIRNRRFDEAEKLLTSFQDRYPTIAVANVMLANLSLIKNDRVTARRYLLQAQALDPSDTVIARMLGSTADVKTQATPNGGPMFASDPANFGNSPRNNAAERLPASKGAAQPLPAAPTAVLPALPDMPSALGVVPDAVPEKGGSLE